MLIEIGHVEAIFRYPVKSMGGERLAVANLGLHGLEGDRRLAFRRIDDRSAFPWLTATKLPDLLRFAPHRRETCAQGDLPTRVRTPDGEQMPVFGADLATEVGRRYGAPVEMMQLNHGIFDEASLSVIASDTVREIGRLAGRSADVRRFRPNVVVRLLRSDPFHEDEWLGGMLSFGEEDDAPAITVTMRDVRCSMVNLDPDSASPSPEVLKAVVGANQNNAGIYGAVTRIGQLAAKQTIFLFAAPRKGNVGDRNTMSRNALQSGVCQVVVLRSRVRCADFKLAASRVGHCFPKIFVMQSSRPARRFTAKQMNRFSLLCATLLAGLALSHPSEAQEWTRFRGPNGSGLSNAKTIPTKWASADFNWKVALPGAGHSSPVLWGEKIFVTAADGKAGRFFVLCFNALDGGKLWQKEIALAPFRKHGNNTLASATPTVDADRVYVCRTEAAHYALLALDHHGQLVWERDLGPFSAQHGSGSSPITWDGKVILANEQDGESFLIAVDAVTGQPRWKTQRTMVEASYSTPCVYQPTGGQPALIFTSGAHGISALAPDTGKVLWEFAGAFDQRTVSSPALAGDLILGSCGNGGGRNSVVAVRPGDAAKGLQPKLAYELRRSAPYVPTSICVGDWVFLWSDAGIVTRIHAATGEVKWQERAGGNFLSSPVCVDGRLFCISTSGEVVVVAAAEKFEVLARNPLGETTHSTPAVAGGRMIIHTSQHLLSIGGAKTAQR